MPSLFAVFSGWLGAWLALVVFGLAFRLNSTALGLLAATISCPFCHFASGYPIFGRLAWTALIGNILAAYFVRRRQDVAFASLTPFGALCVFLAVLAVRGIRLAHS